ncbi:ribonuclease H-like protein, partial [Trametopsis cervina]
DGSDIDGGVGAAAVLYTRGKRISQRKTLRHYLGTSGEHTVYEAELAGMLLALQLLRNISARIHGSVFIALDNRAAIQAASHAQSGPAHYLLHDFHSTLCTIKRKHPNMRLTLRWVPGHTDIEGNEQADDDAKQAAHQHTSPRSQLPARLRKPLPSSASKLRQ